MYDFGLTSQQFWDLTPSQFAALSKRHDQRILHEERGPATTSFIISNLFRGKDQKKLRVEDIMPHGFLVEPSGNDEDFSKLSVAEKKERLALIFPRGGQKKGKKPKKGARG